MAIMSRIPQGNSALLDKIDKLRERLGPSKISLPQLVVVGDQSSGKSSVLEGITGFAFPRAAELCTRYATQITCRRDETRSVSISIMPHVSARKRVRAALGQFHETLESSGSLKIDLEGIFRKANEIMGIRMGNQTEGTAFSQHILKIEISGPEQEHFTVIDVPGIFRRETAGVTEESDIELVRTMVENYMKDERTIILAIIPSNVDPATQEILKLAKKVDPQMRRTMGVLTKPDLNIERTTQNIAIEHVMNKGKYNDLTLGYYIVKNRGPDDGDKTLEQGLQDELNFFNAEPWSKLQSTGRAGMEALKLRVRELLSDLIKKEFPNLQAEVKRNLKDLQKQKKEMGSSRSTPASQIEYLSSLSERYQAVIKDALDAHYSGHDMLVKNPSLRLITRIVETNEIFSDEMEISGHSREFQTDEPVSLPKTPDSFPTVDQELFIYELMKRIDSFDPDTDQRELYPEMEKYLDFEPTITPQEDSETIMDYILSEYKDSRGRDLGTFSRALIATLFRGQSQNWEPITQVYVTRVIILIHHFLREALISVCPDQRVFEALWTSHILEALQRSYDRAVDHMRLLLAIERKSIPYTLDHSFNQSVHASRVARMTEKIENLGVQMRHKGGEDSIEQRGVFITNWDLSNLKIRADFEQEEKRKSEHIVEQVHDVLKSYYSVARKRFVDVVCQQVVEYMLLGSGEEIPTMAAGTETNTTIQGPLHVFTPKFVRGLTDEELESIAGEEEATRRKREKLESDIEGYEAAWRILKGVA